MTLRLSAQDVLSLTTKTEKTVRELSLAQQGALSSTSSTHNKGLAQQLRLALFKGLTNRSILALSLTVRLSAETKFQKS